MTYEEAVERFSDTVTRVCMLKCRNYHNAEDCYQNVMLKLYQNADSVLRLDGEAVKKWLIRVALNECTSLYRRLTLHRTQDLDGLILADESASVYDRELLDLVMRLPQKYRDVLYLYYYEDYSIGEVAETLGCPQSTVKTRLRRGKARLKVQLEDIERLGETL
jgi:RNA polymerase sigma-70 factor (ECF subfamily)